jgi:hypothetical protein
MTRVERRGRKERAMGWSRGECMRRECSLFANLARGREFIDFT